MGICAGSPYKSYESTVRNDDKWETFLKTYDIAFGKGSKFFVSFKRMDKDAKGISAHGSREPAIRLKIPSQSIILHGCFER